MGRRNAISNRAPSLTNRISDITTLFICDDGHFGGSHAFGQLRHHSIRLIVGGLNSGSADYLLQHVVGSELGRRVL